MTDHERRLTEAGRKAAIALSEHTLRVARPLYWHIGARRGGIPTGASAFILQFDHGYVSVTADHVAQAYLDAKNTDSRIICQLGYAQIALESCIIARSEKLDIATFAVNPEQLKQIDGDTIDCRNNWPPPEPKVGDTIVLTGFLDNHRIKEGPQHYTMVAWGAFGIADAVTSQDIVTFYDPERVAKAAFAIEKPPLGFNLSGCSGGPALLVRDIGGIMRWHPVGLIYKGPDGKAQGEFASFDRIHARRLHFIQPDGSIKEPDSGWLP